MKSRKTNQALLWAGIALIAAAGITATARAAEGTDSIIATVTDIDQKTREVTLKGPMGNSLTFIAGPEIQRLNEVQVGDRVHVDYTVSVAAELREPTEEEKEHPLTTLRSTSRAATGAPSGSIVDQVKAVVTIEVISRPTGTITIKGPRGRYSTVRLSDPSRLEKLRIGQTIVLTYTDARAIALEKVSSAAPN